MEKQKKPRIFIAVRLTEEFKQSLIEAQQRLRERGVTGNYASVGNYDYTGSLIGDKSNSAIFCNEKLKQAVPALYVIGSQMTKMLKLR